MSTPAVLSPEQQTMLTAVQEQMRNDGTRQQLKAALREKLIEAQWKQEISAYAQSIIQEKGLANVTVEDLVAATQQKAAESVPPQVKAEMMRQIRQTLIDNAQ